MGEGPALIVICGAVVLSRLEAPPTVITIGRSPTSTVEGNVKVTRSVPGKSEVVLLPAVVITVVPIVAVIAAAALLRTPVIETRKMVAACVPVPSFVVTVNGSGVQTAGLVALHTTALPPGPFVLVKMSGCAPTMVSAPRITVPLLLMAIG